MPTLLTTEPTARKPEAAMGSLVAQVARVGQVDPHVLDRVRHEVLSAAVPWKAEYGPYQSGGWWTTSLMNESGDDGDVMIRDCEPIPTGLLRRLPATRRLLEGSGLPLMWVRLARLAPNSFLWEHRDYADLHQTPRHRLHVPLVTNPTAFLVTGGTRIALTAGHVWRLQPTYAHGACNLLGPDRLHLIADVYGEPADTARLDPVDVEALPPPRDGELDGCLNQACQLAELGFVRSAERFLLRQFYRYSLDEGQIYDLIVEMHDRLGRPQDAERWTGLRSTLLNRVTVSEPQDRT